MSAITIYRDKVPDEKKTRAKPESVALGGRDCWEGQGEVCPSADRITNRVKSADDSKGRSEKGSVANTRALRELEPARSCYTMKQLLKFWRT